MAANYSEIEVEEENSVVSIKDIVDEEDELQQTANAVLGDSDDTNCTYSKGYVSRQALYSCATCSSTTPPDDSSGGGVCLACSLKCHDGHELYELYTKRNFKCDCGNSKFPNFYCLLYPDKSSANSNNKYNHNFRGRYCKCDRPYPDIEDEVEDEMIQCIVCEDWFHTRHLQAPPPDSYEEMVCDLCIKRLPFLNGYRIHRIKQSVEKEPSAIADDDTSSQSSEGVDVCDKAQSDSKPDSGTGSSPCSSSDIGLNRTQDGSVISEESSKGDKSEPPNCCILTKKMKMLSNEEVQLTTGYFMAGWRAELCGCGSCNKLYKDYDVEFLTDVHDSITSYETRARNVTYLHEAGMDAMSSSMGRVQQVEMIHEYNSMKQDLFKFLKGFSESNKVVHSRDIEDFFGELQERKRRRMDSGGEGIPPNSCH